MAGLKWITCKLLSIYVIQLQHLEDIMKVNTPEKLDNELTQAYKTAAKTVHLFGEKYLPLFQRLHKEVERRSNEKSMKILAMRVANE